MNRFVIAPAARRALNSSFSKSRKQMLAALPKFKDVLQDQLQLQNTSGQQSSGPLLDFIPSHEQTMRMA